MSGLPFRRDAWSFAAAVCAVALWPADAHASGDIGCTPAWKLRHHDFTGCDNMVTLSPGNDTRVNLTLLLARRQPHSSPSKAPAKAGHEVPGPLFEWPTFEQWTFPSAPKVGDDDHAAGEGSRCLSDAAGTAAFAAALAAVRGVSDVERASLIAARRALQPSCTDAGHASAATAVAAATQARSAAGKAFATYLDGTAAFYSGNFEAAAARFSASAGSGEPWVCVAEFVRLNNLDGFFLDIQPPADELGGTTTRFPGRPFSRLETYKALIAHLPRPPRIAPTPCSAPSTATRLRR